MKLIDVLCHRQQRLCHLCGYKMDDPGCTKSAWRATVDHYIPLHMGGSNKASNKRAAHFCCNVRKGATFIQSKPLAIFEWELGA
jgi:hypothetical protein